VRLENKSSRLGDCLTLFNTLALRSSPLTLYTNEEKMKKTIKKNPTLSCINQNAAGIDIGAKSHFVAVPEGRDSITVREFSCFTSDLQKMVSWLKACKVDTIVMESTSVYWIPVFEILEQHGFKVLLADARHVKNVSGRKSDVLDCQWLQQLHAFGLIQGAFRPEDNVVQLRSLMRQRNMLITSAAAHVQHIQKAFTQMNIQIHHVISDITGVTGMKIIRAIVAGERDAQVLASLRHEKCHNSEEVIRQSLEGNWRKDHLFALKQAVELYDFYHKKIIECDEEIQNKLNEFEASVTPLPEKIVSKKGERKPRKHDYHFDLQTELVKMTGVDLTKIPGIDTGSALKIISEIGLDMDRWPTSKHFASWLGLCPGTKISGGKRLSGKTKKCNNRAALALRLAANALYHSKSALGAYLRRMKTRLGSPKAITACAHKLAICVYNMLKNGMDYVEKGINYYEEEHKNRVLKHLRRRAKDFGLILTDPKQAVTTC
jgi:transposase